MTPITFTTDKMVSEANEFGITQYTTTISAYTMLKAIVNEKGFAWVDCEIDRMKQLERDGHPITFDFTTEEKPVSIAGIDFDLPNLSIRNEK